jgi:hypothetical protein
MNEVLLRTIEPNWKGNRMRKIRSALAPIVAVVTMAAVAVPPSANPSRSERRFCTLVPGTTLALIRVEQDTTLQFAASHVEMMSGTGVGRGPGDSLLATPATPMPAARVRLLKLDSSTRAVLDSSGIKDREPIAFIRAAPYRADCRTVLWTDTSQFAARGELSYVRATLAPRENWINGVPVLVIPDVWNYPYPRRRGLAFGVSVNAPLASPEAMFSLNSLLEMPPTRDRARTMSEDSARRTRAIAWAVANPRAADMEPARSMVRRAVLDPDWEVASKLPSRLRGVSS